MHLKPAAFVAALLTSRVAALALPSEDVGSSATGDGAVDLIAAYESIESSIPGKYIEGHKAPRRVLDIC